MVDLMGGMDCSTTHCFRIHWRRPWRGREGETGYTLCSAHLDTLQVVQVCRSAMDTPQVCSIEQDVELVTLAAIHSSITDQARTPLLSPSPQLSRRPVGLSTRQSQHHTHRPPPVHPNYASCTHPLPQAPHPQRSTQAAA